MKNYLALLIGVTALALAPALFAQQCYTPVTSWKQPIQESYSLTANSNGSISCTAGTCTMNQAAEGDLHLSLAGINCSQPNVFWQSTDTITSAGAQDTSSTLCPPEPPLNVTLTGTNASSLSRCGELAAAKTSMTGAKLLVGQDSPLVVRMVLPVGMPFS